MPKREFVTLEQTVDFIRRNRPSTTLQIAEALGVSNARAGELIRQARRDGLVRIKGKTDRGRFLFVPMFEWPADAPASMQEFARKAAGSSP